MLGYFYGDIVGLEGGASGLRSDQPRRRRASPAGGASAKEMSSTRLRRRRRHQSLLRQQPGRLVPAPLTSLPRLQQVRVQKTEPAILRPARAPCRARRLPSQAAAADEK